MTEIDPIAFGRMQAELEQTRDEIAELRRDVKALTELLQQGRGSWRMLVFVGSVVAALVAFRREILAFLGYR